jgi:hypothetical protein
MVWIVETEVTGNRIRVYPRDGFISLTYSDTFVSEPGWLATKLGDTLEKRIERAIRSTQKICDRQNALIETEKRLKQKLGDNDAR